MQTTRQFLRTLTGCVAAAALSLGMGRREPLQPDYSVFFRGVNMTWQYGVEEQDGSLTIIPCRITMRFTDVTP